MIESLYNYLAASIGHVRSALSRAEGQALIEVALVVSLVSMVMLGTISMTGSNVRDVLGQISGSVSGTQAGATTTQTLPVKVKKKKKNG